MGESADNMKIQNILYMLNRAHIIEFGGRLFLEPTSITLNQGAIIHHSQNSKSYFNLIEKSDVKFIKSVLKRIGSWSTEQIIKFVLNDQPYKVLPKRKNGDAFITSDKMVCIFAPWKYLCKKIEV